jgi:hypothetical protein
MRRTSFCIAALLAFTTFGFAQEARRPEPTLPAEVLGPQLIAWSEFQKPHPVAQPLPPSEATGQPLREQQSQEQGPAADSQTQQQSAQVFTGTIVKDGNMYVLKAVDGAAYQLDDQDRAKRYEGKQVKIAGKLDAGGNVVHVTTIELIS